MIILTNRYIYVIIWQGGENMGRITERYDEYLPYADYNGENEDELFEVLSTQAQLLAEKGVSMTLTASTNAQKIYVNNIYPGKITPYHNHEYYEINYVHKGKVAEYIEGHNLVLSAGDAILMSPSVKHTAHPIGETVAVNIIVAREYAETAEKMLSSYSTDNYLKLIVKNSVYAVFRGADVAGMGEIVDELARFNQNIWQYEPYVEPSLDNLSKRLFLALTRAELFEHSYQKITRFSDAVKKESAMQYITRRDDKIMWYINDNYNTVTRESLAKHFGYSGQQIARIIKKRTGTSFTTYIQVLRLTRATELLRNTDLPIKEIAERVGAESPEYFTRWFKREHRVTPTAYRERYR